MTRSNAASSEREMGSVGEMSFDIGVGLHRRGHHRRRKVNRDDIVTERLEVTREPPFATPEVERPATGRRYQLEELVAMEEPIAVVPRLPGPRDELRGVLLPGGGQIRRLQARSLEWAVWRLRHGVENYGASRARTGDLLSARQTLSQLSYGPRSALSLASSAKSSAQLIPRRRLLRDGERRS